MKIAQLIVLVFIAAAWAKIPVPVPGPVTLPPTPSLTLPPTPSLTLPPSVTPPPTPSLTLPPTPPVTLPPSVTPPPTPSLTLPPTPSVTVPQLPSKAPAAAPTKSTPVTPAPTPTSTPKVNPELIGKCCVPGHCDTATPNAPADCARNQHDGKSSYDYATCKTQAGCETLANSCGGANQNSEGVDVSPIPGQWCTKSAYNMQCCTSKDVCGTANCKKGSGGHDITGFVGCAYQSGCEGTANQCGGYKKAGVWCSSSSKSTSQPTSSPSGSGSASKASKKEDGSLSGGAIAGIAIGVVCLVGVGAYMATGGGANDDDSTAYQKANDDGTYIPPSNAAEDHSNNL